MLNFRLYLHIFALFNLAVACPLLNLLQKNGAFFTSHDSFAAETVLFVAFVCFLTPLLLVLIELGVKRVHVKLFQFTHNLLIAFLIALLLSFALRKIDIGAPLHFLLCLTTGVLLSFCYVRFYSVKLFFDFLTPAIILVPFLFFYHSQTFKNIFTSKETSLQVEAPQQLAEQPPPVIMIVFDEFPVMSLLDEHNKVDPIRYPNFHSFAGQSHWFRKAMTTAGYTHLSLPSLLTGKRTMERPSYEVFPENLFTLLGKSHHLYVHENVSSFCPRYLNNVDSYPPFYKRFASLLVDASVVSLHLMTPENMKDKLPFIDNKWAGFTRWTQNIVYKGWKLLKKDSLSDAFSNFNDPPFVYMHFLYPHEPWYHLPSGNTYLEEALPAWAPTTHKWLSNEWLVTQAYQRHLLQIGFVDTILGGVIALFKEKNLFDRSLFIVVADHGISLTPNENKRYMVGETNFLEVMNIPLFIKLPYQKQGIINDNFVEITDILPTIAGTLGLTVHEPIDGVNVFSPDYPTKEELYFFARNERMELKKFTFSTRQFEDLDKIHQRKLDLFGSGTKSLFHIGAFPELIGLNKNNFPLEDKKEISLEFPKVILNSNSFFTSTYLKGYLKTKNKIETPVHLAILVNDKIEALTQTYIDSEERNAFTALIPEESLKAEENRIEIFMIEKTQNGPKLFSLKDSSGTLLGNRFIYSRNPTQSLPKEARALLKPALRYEMVSPTSYKVNVDAGSEFVLIFSKPYDPNWKAYTWLKGKKEYFKTHGKFKSSDLVNGYYIDQIGQYTLWLESELQEN